ncbi:MAG TPA: GIY-YIG nuclease family protein [Patescibacteria group bacterium]|nr:GIY-YIG nuclease family protein [Patescibacteria group bacterium]
MPKYFYTYVLLSQKEGSIYIGWTNDLNVRVNKHNLGKVFSTKSGRPWKLIYFEACLSRKNAIAREKQLKTGFGRKYLRRRTSLGL